jgi:hypothetical protein
VNGAVGDDPPASQPTGFQIRWNRDSQTLSVLCLGADPDCQGGLLSHDTQHILPLLIYVDGPVKVCEDCSNKTFHYAGHAVFLAKDLIHIDPSLLTACAVPCADAKSFPQKNSLGFLTPSDMNIGLRSNRDMMGIFYSGGTWTTAKQTNIVGAVAGTNFNMGSQVPSFFQVPALSRFLPETLFPAPKGIWRIAIRSWKECRGAVVASQPCTGFGET